MNEHLFDIIIFFPRKQLSRKYAVLSQLTNLWLQLTQVSTRSPDKETHECQDHSSRETFQVQVSANICKLMFHEGNKKLPMHGIANLLSIT